MTVASIGAQAAALGQHDAAGERHRAHERVRVVVSRDEHERVPEPYDPKHQRELERRAARGEIACEEERPRADCAVERGKSEQVVVQVRRDDEAAEAQSLPLRGLGDQPREPHELLVQLLRDHPRGPLRLLDGPQRDRDVRTIRVVLRVRDLAARRQEEGERETARQGRPTRRDEQPAQRRRAVPAHGQRHDQPGAQAAEQDQ